MAGCKTDFLCILSRDFFQALFILYSHLSFKTGTFRAVTKSLQSATKGAETLRGVPDFKRGKYSFSSPIPSMQCCTAVQATYTKQQTPQHWMEGTGEGCGFFCFLKLSYLSIMSQQFCCFILEGVLTLWRVLKKPWRTANGVKNSRCLYQGHIQSYQCQLRESWEYGETCIKQTLY